MLVSPVNFSGAAATNFQDKIKQPQAYVRQDAPMASTQLNAEEEKSSIGKIAAGVLGAAALVAVGLGVGKKCNAFDPGRNQTFNKVKEYLDVGGEHVLNAAGMVLNKLNSAKDAVVGFFSKDSAGATRRTADNAGSRTAEEVRRTANETAGSAADNTLNNAAGTTAVAT